MARPSGRDEQQVEGGENKTVHFGGVIRIPEEDKEGEELEEKAVATLSLSVQVPAGDGKTMR